jgi:two-component system OmpR family response regulator
MKVLIVEDEKRLAQALEYLLREQKIMTDVVYDGKSGYEYASSAKYDLLLLDIMLPEMDGMEVARKLREDNNDVPILMLTAKTTTHDKVNGLNTGADDYMTKPFDPDELIARVNALTRRHGTVVMNSLSFGDIKLDINTNELSCRNESVSLNYKEAELMKIFMKEPGNVFSKDRLITDVWGMDSEAMDNNVEAYISFLRKKLKFIGSCVSIKNQQKLGYKLEEQ